jgi:putative tricarboxylic transport membrane protein
MAPLLLGFILGGMLEDNLRRSLIISDGNLSYLLDRPISLLLATLIVLALTAPLARKVIRGTLNARS